MFNSIQVNFNVTKQCTGGAASSSRTEGRANPVLQPRTSATSWEGANSSQPTTTIQIRLADGSRMVSHAATQSIPFPSPFFLLDINRILPMQLCEASHLSPNVWQLPKPHIPVFNAEGSLVLCLQFTTICKKRYRWRDGRSSVIDAAEA